MRTATAGDDRLEGGGDAGRGRSAADALRIAARSFDASGDLSGLRDATRALAAESAARGLRAEELVIAFKQLWTTIPELHPLQRHARPVVDELVTLCINEYYRRRASASQ